MKPLAEQRDLALVAALEASLAAKAVTIDRLFFDWRGGARRTGAAPETASPTLEAALAGYAPAAPLSHPYWSDAAPCAMHIDEVEAIWAAIADADDWAPLHAKVAAIRRMGEAHAWPR